MEQQAAFNLVYKWFLGLSVEELPPDFSTLCRFRARLGAAQLHDSTTLLCSLTDATVNRYVWLFPCRGQKQRPWPWPPSQIPLTCPFPGNYDPLRVPRVNNNPGPCPSYHLLGNRKPMDRYLPTEIIR